MHTVSIRYRYSINTQSAIDIRVFFDTSEVMEKSYNLILSKMLLNGLNKRFLTFPKVRV